MLLSCPFKSVPAMLLAFSVVLHLAALGSTAQDFYLDTPQPPQIPDKKFVLTDFGGAGDGKTMNTEAFARAIAACAEAGGGAVTVPAGTYLTGPIKFVSKMALVIEKGALLQASDKFSDFGLPDPLPATQSELNQLKPTPLITGSKLTDVEIRGEGTIDGAGGVWWVKSDIASQRGLQAVPPLAGASPPPTASPASSPDRADTDEADAELKPAGPSVQSTAA